MSILGRYIFRQAFGALLLILLSLTGMIWIAVALKQMELMTAQGQGALVFFQMTGLALPSLVAFIAPIALLISVLQVLNRLGTDSELIVMTAGGQPSWRLLYPLMFLGLLVSGMMAYLNHFGAPWANRVLRETIVQVRTDLISQVLQPGRFSSPEANLTIHIRDRRPDGQLLGLLMHDGRDAKQLSTYLAERGRIVKQGDAAYLLMDEGHILRRSGPDQPTEVITFEKYAFDINRLEQKGDSGNVVRPRERTSLELMRPDPDDPLWKTAPGRYISELHDRFAASLYPFAFMLIAVAAVGQTQTTRQNRNSSLVSGFAAAFGLRVLGIAAANTAVIRPSTWWVLYAIPLGGMLLASISIAYNLRPRPQSALGRHVEALGSAVVRGLSRLLPRRGEASRARA